MEFQHVEDKFMIQVSDGFETIDPLCNTDQRLVFYTPGETIAAESSTLPGHGTYVVNENDKTTVKTSVSGILKRVNKLILVRPLRCRFAGQQGDVVVGRISELQDKRWKVDINYRLLAILPLSGVNLPGGELRRRGEDDIRTMRKTFNEGDLISAEIQNIHPDGALFLHTRSLKYGKLTNGLLIEVNPSLIKHCKTHFFNVKDMKVILGKNGLIWLQSSDENEDSATFGKSVSSLIRLKSCILALAASRLLIYDTSMELAMEASKNYELYELVKQEVMLDIAVNTQHQENAMKMLM